MNAFTEMRIRHFESASKESFAEYYLAHRCYVSDQDDAARNQLRREIASIRVLCNDEHVSEEAFLRLLAQVGNHLYLNRYMIDLVVRQKAQLLHRNTQNVFVAMLTDENNNPQRMACLLDVCIECALPLLSIDHLYTALDMYRNDYELFSVLLEYVYHFAITDCADYLYGLLGEDLPENIVMQIIDILIACDPSKQGLTQSVMQKLVSDKRSDLYLAYLDLHSDKMKIEACGIVVVQPIFYGDPEDSGKGKSGGLGTLLKTLGNQLSKQQQISQVITLTINQDWSEPKPFLHQYEPGHWLVRLPVYLNADDPHAFVKRELSIKRMVARFLNRWHIKPDLFHVRYLDNASMAMASLSKEMHAKLIFTLTPDPHRSMVDADGNMLCFKVEETLEKLNKVSIGDALLAMTDGIVGIGGESVKQELALYFPQLHQAHNPSRFRMIGEGIDTGIEMQSFDVWQFIEDHTLGFRIHTENRNRPVILNVGRLNRQKGQHHLLKAWGASRLWQDFNLIIIGGSRESKDAEEQQIIAFFAEFMASNPHLVGRFAHVGALPNDAIRRVERKLMEGEAASYPNVYVCSSAKEEFGISILEALSEGFLCFAPIKGGVKTYLTNGVNGFLVDTTNALTLANDMERVLYHARLRLHDFKEIQHAGKRTVLDQFSIEEIAKRFLEMYLGLSDSDKLLCVANGSMLA